MIKLQDVHYNRNDRSILSEINLEMRDGEQWVILGRNGSGKTTILELITGYTFPSRGTVEVNGFKYSQCDIREVRKKIGYISQSLLEKLTLGDSVLEVVATGEYGYLRFYEPIPDEALQKAAHMLERVKLGHVKDQPLASLSQGERKKIMLARALMNEPKLLIMDEPCSGLDMFEREKLLEDIEELKNRNLSIIYVTHHLEEIMPMFTHLALLENGRIVAQGSKSEVLTAEHLHSTFQIPLSIDWYNGRPWAKVL